MLAYQAFAFYLGGVSLVSSAVKLNKQNYIINYLHCTFWIKYNRESEELHLTNLRFRLQGCEI